MIEKDNTIQNFQNKSKPPAVLITPRPWVRFPAPAPPSAHLGRSERHDMQIEPSFIVLQAIQHVIEVTRNHLRRRRGRWQMFLKIAQQQGMQVKSGACAFRQRVRAVWVLHEIHRLVELDKPVEQ